MEVAMGKIRPFAINCFTSPTYIVLHDSQSKATLMYSCTNTFAAKYFGFFADHNNDDASVFDATEKYLQKATSILIPNDIKRRVYPMQIVPKVLYVGTKAYWSLKQYRQLDKYPSQLLKHIGGLMPSSPNAILYFPADQCGSGLYLISDLAQAQIWRQLALDPGKSAQADCSTICFLSPLRQIFSRSTKYLKGFAGRLVEWGDSVSRALTHSLNFFFMTAILQYRNTAIQ